MSNMNFYLVLALCFFTLALCDTSQVFTGLGGVRTGASSLAGQGLQSRAETGGGVVGKSVGQSVAAATGQNAAGLGQTAEAARVQGVNGYTGNAAEQTAAFGANGYNQNVGQAANAAQMACQTFVCVEWFDAQGLEIEKARLLGHETGIQNSVGSAGYNQAALAGYGQNGLYNLGQARYVYQPYAAAFGINRGIGTGINRFTGYGGGAGLNGGSGFRGQQAVAPIPFPVPGYAPFVGGFGPGVGYGAGYGVGSELGRFGTEGAQGYGANYGTGVGSARSINAVGNMGAAAANVQQGQGAQAIEGSRAGAIKSAATNVAAGAATDRLAAYNKQGFKNVGKKCMRYQCFQNLAAAGFVSAGPNYYTNYGAGVGRAALQGAASNYGAAANQATAAQGLQSGYQAGPYATGYGYGTGTGYGTGYGAGYGSGYGSGYGNAGYGGTFGGVGGYY